MSNKVKGNVPVTNNKELAKGSWSALTPLQDMEHAFDRFFSRRFPSLWRWNEMPSIDTTFNFEGLRLPSLDVVDRDSEVLVRAEIPGIEKKDLRISLADNLLTIKGQTKSESKEEEGDYYHREISSSSFARSVTLPCTVDSSKTVANLKDGMLEITLPKMESSKRRNIEVK